MERIKIRCQIENHVFIRELSAELAFEMNGHRFMVHLHPHELTKAWRVTCALSGCSISESTKKETAVDLAYGRLSRRWENYMALVKSRPRASWRPRRKAV